MSTLTFPYNTPVQFIPGVGKRTAQVLHSLDIYTAGQLTHIPEPMLVELFGPSIRSIMNLVHGSRLEKQEAPAPRTTPPEKAGQSFSLLKRLHLAAQFVSLL